MVIYCDGSVFHHYPGRPCYAAYVATDGGQVVAEWCGKVKGRDINQIELRAILEALRWAAKKKAAPGESLHR